MKRPKNIQGDQLANATRHEVFAKLLPEAPHQKAGLVHWKKENPKIHMTPFHLKQAASEPNVRIAVSRLFSFQ